MPEGVPLHDLVVFHATTYLGRHRQPWTPPDGYFIGRQELAPAHIVIVGLNGVQYHLVQIVCVMGYERCQYLA